MLLERYCAYLLPGRLGKMQILTQWACGLQFLARFQGDAHTVGLRAMLGATGL